MTRARDYGALRVAACQLVAAGAPMQGVARELDVSFSAVQAWCRRAGVRSRWPYPLTEAARAELRRRGPDILLPRATGCHTVGERSGHEAGPGNSNPPRGQQPGGGHNGRDMNCQVTPRAIHSQRSGHVTGGAR